MPFFMDRHDVEEPLSPKELAMAHLHDIIIQEEHECKVLTYWRSNDHKSAFCLIQAPSAEKLKNLHAASHGLVPNEIIEVKLSEVETILGRTTEPIPVESQESFIENIEEYAAGIDSAFRVIMFTDLKDSTLMLTELGQDKALELLRTHNGLIRKAISKNNGNEVKHTGDGLMISFLNVDDALACAFSIQNAFSEHNEENPEDAMYIRIGLSAGEPVFESNDFYGTSVNLASRICDISEPGRVLSSEEVQAAQVDSQFVFTHFGLVPLKGFKEAVPIFNVNKD
jgi:class 3 adenylate cyclase